MVRLIAVLFVTLSAALCRGALYFETGDAGRELGTSQTAMGIGVLDGIIGNLDDNFDVDLYSIMITDPAAFSAGTIDFPGFFVPDPQLFLFDHFGRAVYMNDDDESGLNGSQSLLPAGHLFGPATRGVHYLAIGWFDNEPFSSLGMMFAGSGSATAGPGIGGAAPLLGWDDNVSGRIDRETNYQIVVTGAALIPEPGTYMLTAAGLIALLLRTRRASAH